MDGTAEITQPVTATALPLTISLFGSFEVKLGHKPVTAFRSNKVRALLAYLVLTRPQPILRTTLIDFFWPDYTTASAQVNLRQLLANLREALAPSMLLQIEHRTVQLAVGSPRFWCDALHFAELVEACRQHAHGSLRHCAACQERLRQAAELYKGAFLENFPEVDSAPFMAWRRTQRHHFAALFADLQAALTHEATAPGNLPAPLTSLVGHTAELPQLAAKLLHPVYRWLTLVGPGGIGKTHLALVLGKHLQSHFPDGVWLVELAALPSASPELSSPPKIPVVSEMADGDRQQERLYDRIAMTISAALGLKLEGKQHPTAELSVYLRNKAALLILDNIDHVSAGADLILKLLQGAPYLRILVTSRHRLKFQSQLVYRVDGLSVPTVSEQRTLPVEELLAHYSSLQLFVERAHHAHADLVLNATNVDAIVHICRLVEGIPWAIELAAALLPTQSPVAILQALQTSYTALQAELYDLPALQHSTYAVFLSSWHLLTAGEAQILARCTVFRGGFTGVAAQVIAGATPTDLQMLMQKSLLHVTAAERYTMHELVRQFAAEQFARQGEAVRPIYDRHAAYYTSFLAHWHLSATDDYTWQATIQPELENIEAAWFWALEQANGALLTEALAGLYHFYRLSGLSYEAQATLASSVAHLCPLIVDPHAPSLAIQQLFAQLLLHLHQKGNA